MNFEIWDTPGQIWPAKLGFSGPKWDDSVQLHSFHRANGRKKLSCVAKYKLAESHHQIQVPTALLNQDHAMSACKKLSKSGYIWPK